MPDISFNAFRHRMADGTIDLDGGTIRALLLATDSSAEAENPDHATVADLLAATGVAEPAAGERVNVGGRAAAADDANDRANITHNAVTFAADAGESAIGVVYYWFDTNDAASIPISTHKFASEALDTGLEITAPNDWLRIT